jgi:predicted ATPase/class 3 adenylate cyclase
MNVTIEQLESAIAALETQRSILGDATVDAGLAPIRDRLAALRAQGAAVQQLKAVSVLFIDIVGSTAMSRVLDPEDIHAVVDGALERFTAIIVARKGRVLQYAGDSILAAFGAEEAREDDAENSIHAALGILAEARRISAEVQATHRIAGFNVRAGINTGSVLLGGGVDDEGSIRGVTVNIAARMEQSAPEGCLRISHDTYRHVRGVFDVTEEPTIIVKGMDEPLRSYLVVRAKPRAFRLKNRGVEGVECRMVGRDLELRRLTDALEDTIADSMLTLLSVVGDAGIGKSRLLLEFATWLELQPTQVWGFETRAQAHGERLPYGVVRELFCWRFQIEESDSLPEARKKLIDALRPLFGDAVEEQGALLGQLIGLDFSDSPFIQGIIADPKQIRDRAFNAAARYFRLLAQSGPVLLQFEDLHWADEGSLDFVNHLAQSCRDLPIMMLCATRPSLLERRPLWGSGQANHERIDLTALTRRTSRELADALLSRVDEPPAVLRELITTGAEGNPFYMEELTKMLIDDGVIVTGADRWRVVPERLARVHVPPTLIGVLQARIDALAPEEKAALQCASVVGHVFWDGAMLALDERSPASLPALMSRELIYGRETTAFETAREFVFKQHVLRQVTYDSVLKRHKREWHRQVANWLIAQSGERIADQYALIAEHFERAGDVVGAIQYLRLAGEVANRAYASEPALDHLARALALVPDDDEVTRFDLLLLRTEALFRTGRGELHLAAAEQMAAIAEHLDDNARRARASGPLARHALDRANFHEAARIGAQGVEWAREANDPDAGLLAHAIWAIALRAVGDYREALIQAERVLQSALALGNRPACLRVMSGLGGLFIDQRRFAEGREYYQSCLPLSRELGNRTSEANTLASLGDIERCLGNYREAIKLAEAAMTLYREVGFKVFEALTQLNIATAMRLDGDVAGAAQASERGLAMARATGNPDAIAAGTMVSADVLFEAGSLTEAGECYAESHAIYRRIGREMMMIETRAGMARVARASGQHAEALKHIEEVLAFFDRGMTVDGTEDPLQIYLTCFLVLDDAGSSRASEILQAGRTALLEQLQSLQPSERDGVLSRVPSHRELMNAFELRTSDLVGTAAAAGA